MLKHARRLMAVVFFLGITMLFLDFSGTVHRWLGWMAGIQFLPAMLALNAGVVVALVALTLLFGRIYCSVICPLGVMQDGFGRLGQMARRNRYSYSKAKTPLRYA
ncbi:MAG: 4Fe-4S binding protein, partial [Paramuribaculum sp.]|nr:4Fe-4S binding protein [Paramuribaculum sp.]